MDLRQRIQHILLIVIGLLCAFWLLLYGIRTTNRSIPIPTVFKQSILGDFEQAPIPTQVTPSLNQVDVSLVPIISATVDKPLTRKLQVAISPQAPFNSQLVDNNTRVIVHLTRPLTPDTAYVVQIFDPETLANFSWTFSTGDFPAQSDIEAVTKLQRLLPYTASDNQFIVTYTPVNDTYYITVHADARGEADPTAALSWLRSVGITDQNSLNIVFVPTNQP